MNDLVRRRFETFQRMTSLGDELSSVFPASSFAGEQFAVIKEAIKRLESHTGAQSAGLSAVRQSTGSKAAARDELMCTLEALSRTARPIAATNPGVAEKFRAPHNQSDAATDRLRTAPLSASGVGLNLTPEALSSETDADCINRKEQNWGGCELLRQPDAVYQLGEARV